MVMRGNRPGFSEYEVTAERPRAALINASSCDGARRVILSAGAFNAFTQALFSGIGW